MMEEQLKKYLKKTENLLNLLHFFSRKEAVPENLEAVYVDFYLRNIIATNYTNFENYLRSCLIVMAEALSEVDFLKESDISEELAIDFIKHCVDQFPHEKKIHTLVGSKSSLVKNLHDMVINKRFKVNIPESTFTQMPHSVAEIEKLLCKYFKQKQILYDILLPIEKEEAFSSIDVETTESAFAFLNRYAEILRHPIVHQGIDIYMNQDLKVSVDDEYIEATLRKFRYIAECLNMIFDMYFCYVTTLKTIYAESEEVCEDVFV